MGALSFKAKLWPAADVHGDMIGSRKRKLGYGQLLSVSPAKNACTKSILALLQGVFASNSLTNTPRKNERFNALRWSSRGHWSAFAEGLGQSHHPFSGFNNRTIRLFLLGLLRDRYCVFAAFEGVSPRMSYPVYETER
jgi:hypothetical protein